MSPGRADSSVMRRHLDWSAGKVERRTETLVALERNIDHAMRSDTEVILTLQCYAYRDGDTWEAICVDFDIATFAPSLDEARASLVTCIELFLEGVTEAPPEDRRSLLRRRSPWHSRAKLATFTWLSRLRNDARHGTCDNPSIFD